MNKQEYMSTLSDKLSVFGDDIKNEIISDYEEHFRMGLANGKSEEQISEELGSIDELVEELNKLTGQEKAADAADNAGESDNGESFEEYADKADDSINKASEDFAKGMNDILKNVAGFLGSMAASITRGTGKFTSSAGEYAEKFSTKAEEYAASFAKGFDAAAGKVVEKSSEFAKEVSDSYHRAMNKEAAEAASSCNDDEACDEADTDIPETAFDADYEAAPNEGIGDETVSATEECDTVIIEADCADVVIDASDDEGVHFHYENNGTMNQRLAYRFDFRQEGRTIYARVKRQPGTSNFFRSLSSPDIELTVNVPDGLKNIAVRAMSGDISCSDFAVEQICINSMSGDVEAENCIMKAAEITTMSGDVEINEGSIINGKVTTVSGDISIEGHTEDLTLKTTSGDISINVSECDEISANSVSGDINIELEDVSGYLAHVKTTCGEINLEFDDESISVTRSGSYVLGEGGTKLNLTTVSGDIDVEA